MDNDLEKIINKLSEFYETDDLLEYMSFCDNFSYDYKTAFGFLCDNTIEDYKTARIEPNLYHYMANYRMGE
jgi:hypothetical protein